MLNLHNTMSGCGCMATQAAGRPCILEPALYNVRLGMRGHPKTGIPYLLKLHCIIPGCGCVAARKVSDLHP